MKYDFIDQNNFMDLMFWNVMYYDSYYLNDVFIYSLK